MKALGVSLVFSIICLMWLLVVWGGALHSQYEWVRSCPWCRRTLRKKGNERFQCNNCGWSE
jgi:hypothetical protein